MLLPLPVVGMQNDNTKSISLFASSPCFQPETRRDSYRPDCTICLLGPPDWLAGWLAAGRTDGRNDGRNDPKRSQVVWRPELARSDFVRLVLLGAILTARRPLGPSKSSETKQSGANKQRHNLNTSSRCPGLCLCLRLGLAPNDGHHLYVQVN